MEKCIFLDRDGVMIEDVHLLCRRDDISILSSLEKFLSWAKSEGYKIVVVTNQTVVSRGLLSYKEMNELNQFILDSVESLAGKKLFDGLYICPHHPEATLKDYRIDCECRKPKPGMLLKAAKELNLDLSKSFFIGDRLSDVIAGNLAGVRTILLEGKFSESTLIKSSLKIEEKDKLPWKRASSFVEIIKTLEAL